MLFDEVAAVTATRSRSTAAAWLQHGDGVLAVFGAPVAHGDDAEHAVARRPGPGGAAGARRRGPDQPRWPFAPARASSNTGPSTMPSGEQPGPDVLYNALGDTVNVAARLRRTQVPAEWSSGEYTATRSATCSTSRRSATSRSAVAAASSTYPLLGAREKADLPRLPTSAATTTATSSVDLEEDHQQARLGRRDHRGGGHRQVPSHRGVRRAGRPSRARVLEGQGVS